MINLTICFLGFGKYIMVKNAEVFVFPAYRSTTIWTWSLMVPSGGNLDDLTGKMSDTVQGRLIGFQREYIQDRA